MRRWRRAWIALVLPIAVWLSLLDGCASFGAGETPPDASAPSADAQTDAALDGPRGDGGLPRTGPFCLPSTATYDYCWDFRFPDAGTGFDTLNSTGERTLFQDTSELTSLPGSLYSEVRGAAGGSQAAARCVQRLGVPRVGTYRLAFNVRLACDVSGSRPTIAELWCTDPTQPKGTMMAIEVVDATTLRVRVSTNDNGTAFRDTGSTVFSVSQKAWTRIEVDTVVGPGGGASVRVDGAEVAKTPTAAVGCGMATGLELLLGTQGTLAGTCAAHYDDVTLLLP
ncbi:MAG: hypothetical protein KF819_06320 [Labilithrix sp.]|nr:hypothetical protein [Labilithrix sp.]